MAWLKFSAPFDFTPKRTPGVTFGYLAGMTCPVVKECLTAALALGVAVEVVETPNQTDAAELKANPYWPKFDPKARAPDAGDHAVGGPPVTPATADAADHAVEGPAVQPPDLTRPEFNAFGP